MLIPWIIYEGVHNFIYLFHSKYSIKIKSKIILNWFRIFIKYLTVSKLLNLKKEKILGFKITAFHYDTIRYLFEEIFYRNEYNFKSDNNAPVIFDCGANIGVATIFFKWLYPQSTIYSFEPDKKTYELLKQNTEQNNFKNVHLYNSALTDRNGTIDFYIDSEIPGSLIMSTKKERISKGKVTVSCLSLSTVIEENHITNIDLIKMDIEGSENEVLIDLEKNNHLSKIQKFIFEYHHKIGNEKSNLSGFLQILERNGFEYQIDTRNLPINSENKFQDVMLYVYRK